MSDEVRVVALFKAKEGKEKELAGVLSSLCGPTRGEDGCIGYDLLQNGADPTDFVFVEQWRDAAALKVHSKSDHLKAGREKMADLVAGPPDVRIYKQIA